MRIVHAPLHGVSAKPRHLLKALRLGKGGVVGFSECYPKRLHYFLKLHPGWRMFCGDTNRIDARKRHVGWDVTLMVRRRHKVLSHGSFKAADEVKASLRVAPERWVVWVVILTPGGPLLVVGAHPHAVPTPGTARARGYAGEWDLIEALIERKRKRWPGLRVVLLGDFNHRDNGGPLTPATSLRRLGMTWHSRGLDWIAWAGLKLAGGVLVISPHDDGQDHPWLVADLIPTSTKE